MITPPPPVPPPKRGYHHGDLLPVAVQRSREIVAAHGPDALTLRGLARALGVTAPALIYHFGTQTGLRAAVAASVLEEAERVAFATAPGATPVVLEAVGAAWIAYAEANPYLYRLASGEGWRQQPAAPDGLDTGPHVVPSPRRVLQAAFAHRTRRVGAPRGDQARAEHLAITLHGLALARIDGASAETIARALAGLGEPAGTFQS